MRILISAVVSVIVAAGPLYAQEPRVSLRRAAQEAVAREAQQPARAPSRAPMSPAVKWTGIGMLIGGGALLLTGVLVDDACIDEGDHDEDFCEDLQTAWIATGAAVAGAGGVVLLVGARGRDATPSSTFGGRRLLWRVRF
jgi:hypothetical protein